MPTTYVSSGQVLSGATISSEVDILSGGVVVSRTVVSGGFVVVSAGGLASGNLFSGGDIIVSSGGIASATTVLGSSNISVSSRGFATNTTFSGNLYTTFGTGSSEVINGGTLIVGGGGTGALIAAGAVAQVQSGGELYPTIRSGGTVVVSSGGKVDYPTVQSGGTLAVTRGATVYYISLAFGGALSFPSASGGEVSFNPNNNDLTVAYGGALTSVRLFGNYINAEPDYTGDSFVLSSAPSSSAVVSVIRNPAGGTGQPTTINTVSATNGGAATVTSILPFSVANANPGGFTVLGVTSGGLSVNTNGGTVSFASSGSAILVPLSGGIVVPLAASASPLQSQLVQAILTLGQTSSSQTVFMPGQGAVSSSRLLASPVLIDLPETQDTILGNAAVPAAYILLDSPGDAYVTGATAASIVAATDGTPVTVINNQATDALIATTGAASNTLEGLAGANQFVTDGQDVVLLNGAANSLTTYGVDAVLVGGPSQVVTMPTALVEILMTAGTTMTFANQSLQFLTDSVTGAAGSTIVVAGPGNAVVANGGSVESFVIDTSAGSTTLRGAAAGGDNYLFVKDANVGKAFDAVYNFGGTDTLSLHGYAGYNVQVVGNGARLFLSDGSQVLFVDASVAAIQQAIRQV